jgi:hypothetical protein
MCNKQNACACAKMHVQKNILISVHFTAKSIDFTTIKQKNELSAKMHVQ